MAATDQQILDAARDQLLKILTAGVEEFGEGGERARMLQIGELRKTIAEYESKVNAASYPVLRRIVTGETSS